MTRIINIMGNSGSGKSVISLNLGVALASKGNDVVLMDGNIYSPDISYYADINPTCYLNEHLDGDKSLAETIHLHSSGLKIIPSIREEEHNDGKYHLLNSVLLDMHGKSEIVLVDSFCHSPAMFAALHNSDEAIFVMNDDFSSVIKSKEFIEKIESKGVNVIGVILNRKRRKTDSKQIENILAKKVIGEIKHDEKVIDSINSRQPAVMMYPDSNFSKSINSIARIIK